MTPRILIVIYGGVVQTTIADPRHIEVEVIDLDSDYQYEIPESWKPLAHSAFGDDIPNQVTFTPDA